MRTCKNCGKDILVENFGLKSFCSKQCKQEYREKYLRLKKREQRSKINSEHVNSKGGYVSINSFDVNNLNPYKSSTSDTQKSTFETEFGNEENCKIATQCCNFELKRKEGYCITLYEPYFRFQKPCRECHVFQALKQDYLKKQAQKKQRKQLVA